MPRAQRRAPGTTCPVQSPWYWPGVWPRARSTIVGGEEGASTAASVPVAADEVVMSAEEAAPRKRKGSKTNLGISCQVTPGAEGWQAESSGPPQQRSRKASKQKMAMNQATHTEIVEMVKPGVMDDDDESIPVAPREQLSALADALATRLDATSRAGSERV